MDLDILDQNYEVLISRYIEDDSQNPEKKETLLSALLMQFQLQDIKILEFFQSLHFYLTNGREQTRQNALNLVYQVFLKYHALQVYETDFFPLLEFFLKKFNDVSLIQQSIQIVNLMLLRYQNLSKEQGFKILDKKEDFYKNEQNDKKIFSQIFQQIVSEKLEISQYSRLIRLQFYKLILFLNKHFPNLCTAESENYITHIIRHTEDEKDPRNIKPAFQILLFILQKFPENTLENHTETLFDNLECYYPIEINSQISSQNPNKEEVNQEDLQNLLSVCLIQKPLYKTTIGFLTEKIASENNYTLKCALLTFQLIFEKYTTDYFTIQELSNIQQNITIINYDTNDQELFTTHIEILSSFIFFLSDKVVHQEIFDHKRLTLIDRICQYFLQILIKEGISSDDTKKSLQILQNLSQTFIIVNKISQPVFLNQMFYDFEKEDDITSKIQWLENLMYFLQGSLQLSKTQYYKALKLNLKQQQIQEIQNFLKKQFDQTENQSFQILSMKLFMIINEFSLSDRSHENKILQQITHNFEEQLNNNKISNQLLDECYLDFCQFFQKIYQNQNTNSQILEKLQKIFQQQFEHYLESDEKQKFSEKIILISLQGLLLPSSQINNILDFFFQKTNNKFYTDKTEKIYQVIIKYLNSNITLQNNNKINFLQIYEQLFHNQIKNKKIELQINTNLKYLNKILYILLEKITNNSQIQNQNSPQDIIQETKQYILESLKPEQTKFNYIQLFTKTIKNSQSLFDKQFQQEILASIQNLIKNDIINKNIHFFKKLGILFSNQYKEFSINQENLPCFEKLDTQHITFKFFIGKLLISSPEALKQLDNIANHIINPNKISNNQETEIDQQLNFFEEILKQVQKYQQKQYLISSPLTSLNIFLLMIAKGCSKTQQNLALIKQFYPQGQQEYYNYCSQQQKELQKTKSEVKFIENQNKTLQMLKLITLSYTSLDIQQKHSSLIMPLLLDLLKSHLNQQQQFYLVKVLYYWTQNNLNHFDSHHRSLIETVVHFFDNEIQDYNTLLLSLECLSNMLKVPYPLFCEFKTKILNILEKYKDHKKRPVRKYAIYILNSIHTME